MKKICSHCNKFYAKQLWRSQKSWALSRFCSTKCANISNSNVTHEKLKGRQRPAEVREKMAKTMFKGGHVTWNKGKPFLQIRGEKHPLWNGGSTLRQQQRTSLEAKQWRKAIFERDNYTCQECGVRGGHLHVDHIKPWCAFPELRFELSNGRVLCIECHRLTDTWGGRAIKFMNF